MHTKQNQSGLTDGADHRLTLQAPLLPPVLASFAKAIYQFEGGSWPHTRSHANSAQHSQAMH